MRVRCAVNGPGALSNDLQFSCHRKLGFRDRNVHLAHVTEQEKNTERSEKENEDETKKMTAGGALRLSSSSECVQHILHAL